VTFHSCSFAGNDDCTILTTATTTITTNNKQQATITSGHRATVHRKQRGWMPATSSRQHAVKAAASIALQRFWPQQQQLSTGGDGKSFSNQ